MIIKATYISNKVITKNLTINLSTADEDELNLILTTATMLDYEIIIRFFTFRNCLTILLNQSNTIKIELNLYLTREGDIEHTYLYIPYANLKFAYQSTAETLDQIYNQLIGDLA